MTPGDIEFKRAEYFFKRKVEVHILKKDGRSFNGLIVELSNDFFVIQDRLNGKQFVLFSELAKPIKIFTKRGVGE